MLFYIDIKTLFLKYEESNKYLNLKSDHFIDQDLLLTRKLQPITTTVLAPLQTFVHLQAQSE